MPGIPGAGGAGGGGGGGGAPVEGIGGGGGGGALGADPVVGGIGGGGGGGADGAEAGVGDDGVSWAGVGELTVGEADLSPAAESGRGGAMVPKRMDASWAALLPPGRSSSESSSDESSSLSVPQSSSSCRFLDTGPEETEGAPIAAPTALAADPAAFDTACVMRKKGLVDSAGGAGGDAAGGAAGVEALALDGASED